jgi:hypothetical protein
MADMTTMEVESIIQSQTGKREGRNIFTESKINVESIKNIVTQIQACKFFFWHGSIGYDIFFNAIRIRL